MKNIGRNGNVAGTIEYGAPYDTDAKGKNSLNNNIQVIINSKGSSNHRSVGVAHEFGHVILFFRGLPHGHRQPGVDQFINLRTTTVSKRLGYDF